MVINTSRTYRHRKSKHLYKIISTNVQRINEDEGVEINLILYYRFGHMAYNITTRTNFINIMEEYNYE